MKQHTGWKRLPRVYISLGCEWRKYRLRNPSSAVLTYAKLVRRTREKIDDKKVWIVACASDSADIPNERLKAASWNRYLYEALKKTPRVVLDLHRYRGMVGLKRDPKKPDTVPFTSRNIDKLLQTGLSQRGFLTVGPQQWGRAGAAMPSVLLENAIHGFDADHRKTSDKALPWPVVMAHADLVRETLLSESLAFLGWTWFPENLPKEWPHGAQKNGKLQPHAVAQAFLSQYHRGEILKTKPTSEAVRGNATRFDDGVVHAYGGNFSRQNRTFGVVLRGRTVRKATVEILTQKGIAKSDWDGKRPLRLPPMSLWRVRFAAPPRK